LVNPECGDGRILPSSKRKETVMAAKRKAKAKSKAKGKAKRKKRKAKK
jgi:hypothetical protein